MKYNILGISAFYHDSAAAIIVNGEIIAAAQEERFTRKKHTADFPINAIKYCLEESGLTINELDAIVFYDKPFLKFERLLQTYYSFAPKGIVSFFKSIPIWLKDKLMLKKMIRDGLSSIEEYDKKKLNLLFTEHHLSHAASAFYPSNFNDAAIVTIDGVGEWCTLSIGKGIGSKISFYKQMNFPHSVGLLYSAFTYYLGFTVNSGEYKLMGLAPYGNPESFQTLSYIKKIKDTLIDIKPDGSIWLNQKYFNYSTGLTMTNDKKWEELFELKRRNSESEILIEHCNLAFAIQFVTEEIVLKIVVEAKKITGAKNLCMAGGVALNCVVNEKILKSNLFENIFIQPASGDAGGAIGAALAAYYMYFGNNRIIANDEDSMCGTYLGPDFSDREVELMNKKVKAVFEFYNNYDDLSKTVSSLLTKGNIVGWFQGKMEFGPRALGNRSILADPRNPEMQKRLNLKIKYREGFRPFAPSILSEHTEEYFDIKINSPYMLFVANLNKNLRYERSVDFPQLSLMEKLYEIRSDIQSVTHLDFTARVQTVNRNTNFRFWKLLNDFNELTSCPILINTSFNVRGEPIVCSPFDAYNCFMNTEMDYLVINNCLYNKTKQTTVSEKKKFSFKKD